MTGDYSGGRACPSCTDDRLQLRREARRNEQRIRAGKPPVMADIERLKAFIAECTKAGHRDLSRNGTAA